MKKLLLLTAILLGVVSASQAGGVHVSVGFPLPLPPLPGITFGVPAPAPVYPAAPAYGYGAPYCGPSVAVAPPAVYFGYPGYYPYYRGHGYRGYYHGGHGYYGHGYYGGHSYARGGHH